MFHKLHSFIQVLVSKCCSYLHFQGFKLNFDITAKIILRSYYISVCCCHLDPYVTQLHVQWFRVLVLVPVGWSFLIFNTRSGLSSFQYFSSVPVPHYLHAVLCIKIWTFSWISCTILSNRERHHTLKLTNQWLAFLIWRK